MPFGPAVSVHSRLLERRSEFLRYFRRHLSRPEDAEDAFQDFCLKVLRAADGLANGERIDAWLRRILRTTLIDHYRRRAARQRAEHAYENEPRVTAVEPEAEAERAWTLCVCVHKALPPLRPDYADILRRADLEEQPREQIASELSLTMNNVGVRLHRARQALKAKIKEVCPTCGDGRFGQCTCDSVLSGSALSGAAA